MDINEIIKDITVGTINGMVIGFWLYMLASLIKWFLTKAKLGLNYLFPNCKWFKSKEGDDK